MQTDKTESDVVKARRDFLATCGKFAVVTPPAITLLLATTGRSYAQFGSGTGPGGEGGTGGGPGGEGKRHHHHHHHHHSNG
jgi:hypothetical protein